MTIHRARGLLLTLLLAGATYPALAQHDAMDHKNMVHDAAAPNASTEMSGMNMPATTLLVAQLDGEQVSPASSSKATGTGAFQLDAAQRTLEYRLTYQGLEAGGPQSIALLNFGRGKNGKVVYLLCSKGRQACPDGASATITGRLVRNGGPPEDKVVGEFAGPVLDNNLVGEFDSERIYVEIVGGDGKTEIRGQLATNDSQAMIENFVAELKPTGGASSNASGTAVLTKMHMPGGKILVNYLATVAGTSDAPQAAAFSPGLLDRTKRVLAPQLKTRLGRDRRTGGSLTGAYSASGTADEAIPTLGTAADQSQTGILVTTSKFPDGELFGALTPVR